MCLRWQPKPDNWESIDFPGVIYINEFCASSSHLNLEAASNYKRNILKTIIYICIESKSIYKGEYHDDYYLLYS